MICGIDEAGRGSLIGPLIIGLVCTNNPVFLSFVKKDSKKLSKSKRENLIEKIIKKSDFVFVEKILPSEINKRNINNIERKFVEKIVNILKPKKLYVDLFEHSSSKINIIGRKNGVKIIAEHKADEKYSVVAAASIIAKIIRDKEIEKISKRIGFFGSGYPSDERTIKFVKQNYDKIKPYLRLKWKTLNKLKKQKKLSDF